MKLGDVQMSLKGDKLIKICKMFFKRKEKEKIWLKHVQSGKSDKKSPEICLESTTFADSVSLCECGQKLLGLRNSVSVWRWISWLKSAR